MGTYSRYLATTFKTVLVGRLRVSFIANDGMEKHGTVLRLNKKTVSLRTDDEMLWKVSPGLLRKSGR